MVNDQLLARGGEGHNDTFGRHRHLCHLLMPRACLIALATQAATGTIGISATPLTPYGTFGTGVSMITVSIFGRSSAVGIL